MLAASLFSANITDIIYPDKQYKNGTLKLTLMLDSSFNASFEQKNEGGTAILIFYGLNSAKSFTKTLNASMIQNISVKPLDNNCTEILLVGKQLFTISVANSANALHIVLTPKTAPFTIENIAKDTGGGALTGYILDTLFYIVMFLFVMTIAAVLFLKFKLFGRSKKANIKTKEEFKKSVYEEAFKIANPRDISAVEGEFDNAKDAMQTGNSAALSEKSTVPQSEKSAENPQKSKKKSSAIRQKTLFD
jgi:hypothetical protein